MPDEIMLDQTTDEQTRDEYIKAKYIETTDELESAFPGKAEKCHRLIKGGYRQRRPNKDGKGGMDKQIIKYEPCPYPKCDDRGNLELRKEGRHKGLAMRCNWEPETKGRTQEEIQIDVIIHHKRHFKWWFDKNSKTQLIDGEPVTRPPTNFPEPWQDPNFPPKWGNEGEQLIMGDDLGTKVLREEMKREAEVGDEITNKEEEASHREKNALTPPAKGDKHDSSGNEKGGSRPSGNASK